MDFKQRYGPWALVTGASSGIGEEFARHLARRGINLVISARREERLRTLAQELIAHHGVEVETLPVDLAAPEAGAILADAVADKDLGLLVSNAGFGLKGLHEAQEPTRLLAMLHTNAAAPLLLTNRIATQLRNRGHGGILLTGSIEGAMPFPYSAAYAASKAFVGSLGEALAWELRSAGVDVLVLCPGSTDTEAIGLQGIDRSKLRGLQSPALVAEEALGQLGRSTVYIPGTANRWLLRLLGWLPRKFAIDAVAKGMKASMQR